MTQWKVSVLLAVDGHGDPVKDVCLFAVDGHGDPVKDVCLLDVDGHGDPVEGVCVLAEDGHGDPVEGVCVLAVDGHGDPVEGVCVLAVDGHGDPVEGVCVLAVDDHGDPVEGVRSPCCNFAELSESEECKGLLVSSFDEEGITALGQAHTRPVPSLGSQGGCGNSTGAGLVMVWCWSSAGLVLVWCWSGGQGSEQSAQLLVNRGHLLLGVGGLHDQGRSGDE